MSKATATVHIKGLNTNKALFTFCSISTLLIPFISTYLAQGSLQELSKAVFALYLIIPTTALIWTVKGTPSPQYALYMAIAWSGLENLDWRLYISQQINEFFQIVINPQWLLIVISSIALLQAIRTIFIHNYLWSVFCAIAICASLGATYAFHYLVINNGIHNAVKDHEQKMMLLDTENSKQQKIVCAVLGLTCIQEDHDKLIEKLNAIDFDRQSIISINNYSKGKDTFYAWRETDMVSAALNGNGVLIGYINKNDKPLVVIDREKYSITMNREEKLFMYLVILFHTVWIPGWLYVSQKHRRIKI